MKHSVIKKVLPNGIELLLIDIPGIKSFDMAIAINAGYRFATKDDVSVYEAPHVLEHIIFDGSRNYENSDALQDVFSRGGGYSNGVTTMYHNIFPFHSRAAYAEDVMKAALDAVYFPLLAEQSFDEEMNVIGNELGECMSDLQMNAGQYTVQQILPDMPISTDGQIARLDNVTLEHVKKYHKKYYGTKNTKILIATSLKEMPQAHLESIIMQATKDAPEGKRYAFPTFAVAPAKPNSMQFVPIHKTTTDSISAVHFVVEGRPSRETMHKLQLFSEMASGLKSFSANYKLRKQGLIYGLSLNAMESQETYGLELSIGADNNRFVEVFAYTLESLRDFAKNGVTDKQFETARQEYEDALDDAFSSTDNIIGWYIDDYFMDVDPVSLEEHRAIIQKLTQEDMLAEVEKIFNYTNLYATVFSSKGIRASAAMELLAKEVLKNQKEVTTGLIESNSIALVEKNRTYKLAVGLLAAGLVGSFIAPLVGIGTSSATLSSAAASYFGNGWTIALVAIYGVILLAGLVLQQGKDLKVTMAQMTITPAVLLGVGFIPPNIVSPYLGSSEPFVAYHAWLVTLLVVTLSAVTLSAFLLVYKQSRASKK